MGQTLTGLVKCGLAKAGAIVPERALHKLNGIVNALEVGAFMQHHGFKSRHLVATRLDVFDLIGREVQDERVLYMEFGVAAGESLHYWSRLLRNPESLLHG